MKRIIPILIASLLPFIVAAQFDNLVPVQVVSVFDGDGCRAKFCDTCEAVAIRFIGIDAPERRGYSLKGQPYGDIAGDTLRKWIKGKTLLFDTLSNKGANQRDYYGRLIAEPYFADSSSVCFALVESGLAWYVYQGNRRQPGFNRVLETAFDEARAAKRGLWASYLNKDGKVARIYKPSTHRRKFSINKR